MTPRAYRILVSSAARRVLMKLPKPGQERLGRAIDALATVPRPSGCTKLAGEQSVYRIRVGSYRIVYEVRDAELVILVLAAGPRGHVYQRMR